MLYEIYAVKWEETSFENLFLRHIFKSPVMKKVMYIIHLVILLGSCNRVTCDVGTSTDDLYIEALAALEREGGVVQGPGRKDGVVQGSARATPVWDSYIKDCWLRSQTGNSIKKSSSNI